MKPGARRHKPRSAPGRPAGPPVELVIEAVGGEGDGVAPGPAFVPFTLPGERVLATGAGERRELLQVLQPS
ncbi:MAG: methyltransferase, TrmA family, partial [Phenylobacterium sp.]|nr:methyltransferase, TrmA family [Phenylobacterium sp.]